MRNNQFTSWIEEKSNIVRKQCHWWKSFGPITRYRKLHGN